MLKPLCCIMILAATLAVSAQGSPIQDPRGFSFQVPTGYKPTPFGGAKGLRGASVKGKDGSAALIVFNETQGMEPNACLDQCLKLVGPQNATLVSDKLFSNQPYVAMRVYTFPSNLGPGRVRMMFTQQGDRYRAFFVMAPEPIFTKDEPTLDGICNSFKFNATPSAP